jgi:hypothetical protein
MAARIGGSSPRGGRDLATLTGKIPAIASILTPTPVATVGKTLLCAAADHQEGRGS